MRLRANKEQFIAKMEREIAAAKNGLDFYNNSLKLVVNNFKGKVINKRFDNAVKALIDVDKQRMFLRGENSYSANERRYCLNLYTEKIGYTSVDLYFSIEIDPETQRIIGFKDDLSMKHFIEGICEREQSIANFDTYNAQMEEVEKAIRALKDIPCYVRDNVDYFDSIYLPK